MSQLMPFITDLSKTSESSDTNTTAKLPDYKLSKHVPSYHKYRNGRRINVFDTIYTVEDNIQRGLSLVITGKEKCGKKTLNDMKFGEQTFLTSGTCGPKSLDDCSGKPRNIIIDTIPSGNFKKRTDYRKETQHKIGNNAGLIPSLIEDLFDFNPAEVLKSFAGKGTKIHDVCQRINFEEKQYFPKKKYPLVKTHSICVPSHPSMLKEGYTGTFYQTDGFTNLKYYKYSVFLLVILLIIVYLLLLLYKIN